MNKPHLPGIPGIEDFKGESFHTSRWDYAYTGGSTTEDLNKLSDKRVGVIGTGATGIQCIPRLARTSMKLYVFQRTPSLVDERNNKPTDPEWAKTLKPGWHWNRNTNFSSIMAGMPIEKDLVADGWTYLFKKLSGVLVQTGVDANENSALLTEIADFQAMHQIRNRIARLVHDPQTAESLKPWFYLWCKRPTFNDEYLVAFNKPNVMLVDTRGKGVDRVTEDAVVVDGTEYKVDCLIFATGFEVGTAYTRRAEFEAYGRDGVALSDYWSDGMKTYHGFLSNGFPNLLHTGRTQAATSPNFTYLLDGQSTHVAYLIGEVLARGARSVEPTRVAEAAWVKLVTKPPPSIAAYHEACTPGNIFGEFGEGGGRGRFTEQFYEGAPKFFDMLARWRKAGDLDGLTLDGVASESESSAAR
jgi:cyclohexanone monooxygenase